MLHTYMTLYGICFMATVVIIILLLLVGTKIDIEEARHYGAEVEPPPTAEDWIGYICKAFLIAFVVSFAAPIVLIFYIFIFGCIVLSAFTDDHY